MYRPPHFREDRLDVQHRFIRAHPLGMLVTAGRSGLLANPVPFLLDAAASPYGMLKAHLARANPQWQDVESGAEVLAIFQGAEAYVTPSWYEAKRETGKVVPTWNYAVVQAYGRLTVFDDPGWIRDQVAALTAQQEAPFPAPWAVGDAPEDFISAQIRGIVGIAIEITRIEGKWKVSQNRSEADRQGVAEGLRGQAGAAAQAMAELVDAKGPKP
ncbi:FMN-binding negative transcriptional regulator [Microvirga thermotolerans]|uniref:FMN-binding negative transcriptional regulator n=1 Tax=Microvirga thermotolerans TaxID=2651334 RepID=A0A5P9JVR9_9HYPH|nr:FMN-binding negative transcriptional regulator [Microvirga thermotolerans]QFU15868.1 FMN-binding negative transcriptional regulator [Microvirga thermotolerans]